MRITAIQSLTTPGPDATAILKTNAKTDTNTLARAAAIRALGKLKKLEFRPIFDEALNSPSPAVEAAARECLSDLPATR